MRNLARAVAAAALATMAPSLATAQLYTSSTLLRGYTWQNGTTTGYTAQNYLAGNFNGDGGEIRNYFSFSIPTFTGTVTAATITLGAGTIRTNQDASGITYTLTSTASNQFGDLGTGTVFGSGTFTANQTNTDLIFTLDSAALAAISSGGTLLVSGRVTSPTVFSTNAPDQFLFGFTGGGNLANLAIVTTPLAVSVPEAASWGMMLLGAGAVGIALRRRRGAAGGTVRLA